MSDIFIFSVLDFQRGTTHLMPVLLTAIKINNKDHRVSIFATYKIPNGPHEVREPNPFDTMNILTILHC